MKQTAAKFVSAIFASVLASTALMAAPEIEDKEKPVEEKEKPADTCLLGPSASVPPGGGHWYYRVDRVNKRNCWYLGEPKDKAARKPVAEEAAAPPEKPAAPVPKKPVAQRALTDAHAELPPQTSVDDSNTGARQRGPAGAPRADTDQRTGEASKVLTSRWPGSPTLSPPAPPAAVTRTAETQATAAPPPRPAAPPAQPARAAAADKPLSLPMLLTVLVGGLSVIGVMASAVFARGQSQRRESRPKRLSRSTPMPPLQAAEKPLQTAEKPLPEKPLPEQPRAPDDPTQRLQQMLAEIQKRAAAA